VTKLYEPVEHVTLWVDNGVIMLRTNEPHGDPIEMAGHEALALSDLLRELAAGGA
jgi:hypothetical protein